MTNKKRGDFIVLYGINNIGKTTQTKKLVNWLKSRGTRVKYLKYPVYSLPTGRKINSILRKGVRASPEALQLWLVLNRYEYEPKLKLLLDHGITVVAEEYIGSGLSWGRATGCNSKWLFETNRYLIKPDKATLLDGMQFATKREMNHILEGNDELVRKARRAFRFWARKLGWKIVAANQPEDKVFRDILTALKLI